jgi:hypothetical protein
VRVKRVKRMSAAPKKAAGTRAKKARSASWIVGPVPIMFAAACVVAFVGAVALNPVSNSPRKPDVAIAAPRADAVAPIPPKPRAKPDRPRTADAPPAEAKKTTTPAETPALPAATLTAPAAQVASVTITGCLEHDDETFWLSDPSGTDAPTSRSWKSGFLKKRPSRIELVDSEHALRLTSYVGHRVSATGTLVNREMQTRALHPLSATCS